MTKPFIHTLIPDIYSTISKKDGWFTAELADDLGSRIAKMLRTQLGDIRPAPRLRMSSLGPKCHKQLWHSVHQPELAEPLPPQAEIKFSYGHIIEALVITLAKASGHEVTGEQDELEFDGIRGHRDCVIDGYIVDVKSCSSRVMDKFRSGKIRQDDTFGYLDQLDGYLAASQSDPLVRFKDKAFILAVDKTLGHLYLYEHSFRLRSITDRIKDYKQIVGLDTPPACTCGTRAHGKSGNIELDVRASYSAYKRVCFPHLREFRYASGPTYLTKVVRVPDVTELDKDGKIVYN